MKTPTQLAAKTAEKISHANVLALAFKAGDGTITVTEILCFNFPVLPKSELAKLSWDIEQFCNRYRAARAGKLTEGNTGD